MPYPAVIIALLVILGVVGILFWACRQSGASAMAEANRYRHDYLAEEAAKLELIKWQSSIRMRIATHAERAEQLAEAALQFSTDIKTLAKDLRQCAMTETRDSFAALAGLGAMEPAAMAQQAAMANMRRYAR